MISFVLIGFICLACPILILLYLQWMPWYISVAFCIWFVSCIVTVVKRELRDIRKRLPHFHLQAVKDLQSQKCTKNEKNYLSIGMFLGLYLPFPIQKLQKDALPFRYTKMGRWTGKTTVRDKNAENGLRIAETEIDLLGIIISPGATTHSPILSSNI